ILAGWAIITYLFFQKPLRYLDEVVEASEQLAQPDNTPIVLSDPMKDIQDELNIVREQALRNAIAAKEAEQRKNDLVVYLAHDLKTPLTSVIGYLTLLKDEPLISQELRAKYTGIALEKAERLESLINEFFDITRFNLTHLTLAPESINLTRMLEQLTFEFNPVLTEKNLRWSLHLTPDIHIVCDPDKLERVFDNLIRNAINYSYPNTAIFVSMDMPDSRHVKLCVENNGKTISPEKLDRLFEQFFRLDTSRSSSTGGAGLGLAIAKEIVELHGGTIMAQSADEHISFTVMLPTDCQEIV
ncbi:MAG: vancomycin resistance histidine kinase VanS, partial [Clostridiaceae bacterium]|nr:vancomycin resistance histidine kinase VanS [Clostridiaceae bacterium]